MTEENKDLTPKFERVVDAPAGDAPKPVETPQAVQERPQPEPLRSEPQAQQPAPAPQFERVIDVDPQQTREEFPRAEEVVPPVAASDVPQAPEAAEVEEEEAEEVAAVEAEDEGPETDEDDEAEESEAPAPQAPAAAPEAGPSAAQPPAVNGQANGQANAPAAPGAPGERREGGRRRRRRRGRGGRGGEGQPQGGQPQGQEKPQTPPPAQGDRPARTERPERGGRGERQERGGRGGREGGRQERPERGERAPRGERAERGERHERGHEHVHRGVEPRGTRKPIKREVLANTSFEETRVAIVEDGRLAELHWERKSSQNIVGNIYKGTVENVLPGISSAFINIGYDKNAYLYISDVLGERGAAIDATLKKGQHIMVQVAKAAIGTKGMKVTMDVSLPGRYLVFTPFQTYVGISKHIADPEERRRLSAIVDKLVNEHLGGRGLVVRTEAEGASELELEREVKYLLNAWTQIQKQFDEGPSPAMLHKDLDLTLQIARDILSDQVYVYLLDNKESYQSVIDFVSGFAPELKERVRLYEGKTPIFKAFHLEPDIESLRKTKVPLPNGGSIVIQEAESLCAIDVNTGRFTGSKSQEETVTQTNIEAANEVAHQLRLRNIGGIVVVDFIDMRKASNRNKVMEAFAHAVKNDRAKIRILPITRLGLIEMTRERKRESTVSLITEECQECKGFGRVLSSETIRIRIQREILEMTGGRPGGQVRLQLHPHLSERMRQLQPVIEKNVGRSVKIQSDPQVPWEDYRIILE